MIAKKYSVIIISDSAFREATRRGVGGKLVVTGALPPLDRPQNGSCLAVLSIILLFCTHVVKELIIQNIYRVTFYLFVILSI